VTPAAFLWLNACTSRQRRTRRLDTDIVPGGDLRLVAGVEVLNGLLLIGWSASYTYIAMERFWNDASEGRVKSG